VRFESSRCRALNPTVGMAAAVIDAGAAYGIQRQVRPIVD
jgi:hypothetical protein